MGSNGYALKARTTSTHLLLSAQHEELLQANPAFPSASTETCVKCQYGKEKTTEENGMNSVLPIRLERNEFRSTLYTDFKLEAVTFQYFHGFQARRNAVVARHCSQIVHDAFGHLVGHDRFDASLVI